MGNWPSRTKDGPAGREIPSGTHYFLHLALESGLLEGAMASNWQLKQDKRKGKRGHRKSSQQQPRHRRRRSRKGSGGGPTESSNDDDVRFLASSTASSPATSLSRTPSYRGPLPNRSSSPSMESMTSSVSTSTTRSSLGSLSTTFELYREPVACTGGSFRPGASIDPMRETPYFDVRPHLEEVSLPTSDSHTHVDRVSYFMLEAHTTSRVHLKKAKIVPPLTPEPSFAIVVQSNTYTTTLRREGRIMHTELLKPNGDCIMFARLHTLRAPSGTAAPGATASSSAPSSSASALSTQSKYRQTFEVRTTSEGVLLARAQGTMEGGFDLLVSDFVTADHPMYSVVLGFVVSVVLSYMVARPRTRRRFSAVPALSMQRGLVA